MPGPSPSPSETGENIDIVLFPFFRVGSPHLVRYGGSGCSFHANLFLRVPVATRFIHHTLSPLRIIVPIFRLCTPNVCSGRYPWHRRCLPAAFVIVLPLSCGWHFSVFPISALVLQHCLRGSSAGVDGLEDQKDGLEDFFFELDDSGQRKEGVMSGFVYTNLRGWVRRCTL